MSFIHIVHFVSEQTQFGRDDEFSGATADRAAVLG